MTEHSKTENLDGKDNGNFKDSDLADQISSSLHKLEFISDHHVKERRNHFRKTNVFVFVISGLILVIAVLNLYNMYYFYNDSMAIINTVNQLDHTVDDISANMVSISSSMKGINTHMEYMDDVYYDVSSMSDTMPSMRISMSDMGENMGNLNDTIGTINGDMTVINYHLKSMSSNVTGMEYNVHQMSRPIGKFNQFFPD